MSADILTQLQTLYAQLLNQMHATLHYNAERHPLSQPLPIIVDTPSTSGATMTTASKQADNIDPYTKPLDRLDPGPEDTEYPRAPFPLIPHDPVEFRENQTELAEDLAIKTQQINELIAALPGLGKGEAEQRDEIRELIGECESMEKVRMQKRKEVRELVRRLESVIGGMRTSVEIRRPEDRNGSAG